MGDFSISLLAAATVALILDLNLLEILLLLGIVAFARTRRAGESALPGKTLRLLRRISSRPLLAYGTILVLATVPRAIYVATTGPSIPYLPDEFSYLLLADTLDSGRLSNPTHPHWEFFETVHVIPKPTYQSQYLPGSAATLVAGKRLFGDFRYGVWLSFVLLSVTLLWALRQWLSPSWAWLAATLATVRFGVGSYWVDSFWGGAVPALGGALMIGSIAAVVRRKPPSALEGIAYGGGASILLFTRPWEGAWLGAGCSLLLLWALVTRRVTAKVLALSILLPAIAILVPAGFVLMRYNEAVTGSPLKLPYQVSQQLYGWPMTLPWIELAEPPLRHRQMELYREWEENEHRSVTTWQGLVLQTPHKLVVMWRFYFGPLLSVLLWVLWKRRRHVKWPVFLLAALLSALAVAVEQTWYPHYIAPAFAAIVVLWAIGLRELARLMVVSRRSPMGTFAGWFVVAVIPAQFAILTMSMVGRAADLRFHPGHNPVTWCCLSPPPLNRMDAEKEILSAKADSNGAETGTHLVFLSAPKDELNVVHWSYNAADIDSSRIVWAWDMGRERNQELIRYYPKRTVWQIYLDRTGFKLQPYESSGTGAATSGGVGAALPVP